MMIILITINNIYTNVFSEFEGAAAELKGWGIPLIKVDGTKEKELADQVRINVIKATLDIFGFFCSQF
jgi:hypothetical protein